MASAMNQATGPPWAEVVGASAGSRKRKRAAAEDPTAQSEDIDVHTAKRLLLVLERRINKNQEMRVKHEHNPSMFLESELELDAAIKDLAKLAVLPALFPLLVSLGTATSLTGLLTHENTDISVDAINIIYEFIVGKSLDEAGEAGADFLGQLRALRLCELLVHNLGRLSHMDPGQGDLIEATEVESRGVHLTLGIIEHLIDVAPDIVGDLVRTPIVEWLLRRMSASMFDANKLFASEVLSILFHVSPDAQATVASMETIDGMETLLQCINFYRKRLPADAVEAECLENTFSCVCAALLQDGNRRRFREHEGMDLVAKVLKHKGYAFSAALRVLNQVVTVDPESLLRFIEIGGLKRLFPAFMGKIRRPVLPDPQTTAAADAAAAAKAAGSQRFRRVAQAGSEDLDCVVSVIAAMLLELKDIPLKRVIGKFVESNFEKCARLTGLHMHYLSTVVRAEQDHLNTRVLAGSNSDNGDDDELDDEILSERRVAAGLYTLQSIDICIARLVSCSKSLRSTICTQLAQQPTGVGSVVQVLDELQESMEASTSSGRVAMIQHLVEYMRRVAAT